MQNSEFTASTKNTTYVQLHVDISDCC